MKIWILAISGFIFIVSGCGGSGNSSNSSKDTITIDMSPLRIIAFSDDGGYQLYPEHPVTEVRNLPDKESALIRVRDPFKKGGFYSILVRNGFGGPPHSAIPLSNNGEPDNTPLDAAILTWENYEHRGLSPVKDEDWFTFTSSGECCIFVSTRPNASGSDADPILEVYNSKPNLGPIEFPEGSFTAGGTTIVAGIFDPTNNLTLITMRNFSDPGFDISTSTFSLVFSGTDKPGDYPVIYAFPPLPDDSIGAVAGSVNITEYDLPGNAISGAFDITINDGTQVSTISGKFNTTRESDNKGLLAGLRTHSSKFNMSNENNPLKAISAYHRNLSSTTD